MQTCYLRGPHADPSAHHGAVLVNQPAGDATLSGDCLDKVLDAGAAAIPAGVVERQRSHSMPKEE
ncbi:hypothetical protein, partial [Scrofimicrobium canadense]|uniref:hypothetical protein n=1 Tax=Scrofimicrobium canadense TaxID=2652290 RepID=UPI00197CF9E1